MEILGFVRNEGEDLWAKNIGKREFAVIQIIVNDDKETYHVDIQYVDIDDYTVGELTDIIKEFNYEDGSLNYIDDMNVARMVAISNSGEEEFTGSYHECYEWVQHWILKFEK